LYDLDTDPSESNDLAAKYPNVVIELQNLIKGARVESALFPFE